MYVERGLGSGAVGKRASSVLPSENAVGCIYCVEPSRSWWLLRAINWSAMVLDKCNKDGEPVFGSYTVYEGFIDCEGR